MVLLRNVAFARLVLPLLISSLPEWAWSQVPARFAQVQHGAAVYEPEFREWNLWRTEPNGPRVFLNIPQSAEAIDRTRPVRLILYATPNGNTIEQTLGCKLQPGQDWHFDIQHVMAQIRTYRELNQDEVMILAVVQAPKLSWPTFRSSHPDANGWIASWSESLRESVHADRTTLTGHSGGGAFIFGNIEGREAIPKSIDRIVFLDANYSFDSALHGGKLKDWLRQSENNRLGVIAYDDREIELNGKKVVGPTGGTYRATERMVKAWEEDVSMRRSTFEEFQQWNDIADQVCFWVHPNSDNKILHTALVGEMNGLLHGLTFGTNLERRWGKLGAPRAYTRWVQSNPFREPQADRAKLYEGELPAEVRSLKCPKRDPNAKAGSEFVKALDKAAREELQHQILIELSGGNMPDSLRTWVPISTESVDSQGIVHRCVYLVTKDYLMIGSDQDALRMPMTPETACKLAETWDCLLITRKVSNDIWQAADRKLKPQPMTSEREALKTFAQHHALIEDQLGGDRAFRLISGIKKDVILTPRLKERSNRVAIFGWHQSNGEPIQPLYVGHVNWYVDYSHGIRLMSNQILIDGTWHQTSKVLNDPVLSSLISDEGPMASSY